MSLPRFYTEAFDVSRRECPLDEDTSLHIAQVLRMKKGDKLELTDGKGNLMSGILVDDHKKHCTVRIDGITHADPPGKKVTIAISLLKNASRFEWFLEKATELGVSEIIPLVCERTIREKFRFDRMKGICISAMLQSLQCWLPILHQPLDFKLLFRQQEIDSIPEKMIAHCEDDRKEKLATQAASASHCLICIGPEGDFTPWEIGHALQNGCIPVSLGTRRLRTETAGIAAAAWLCQD